MKKSIDKFEEIEATGQDSEEKAIKAVREIQEKEDKEQKENEFETMEKLWTKRRTIGSYKDALLQHMKKLKDQFAEEVPSEYQWYIVSTEEGIALTVRQPDGRWVAKGTKVCGEPKYDINAVERLLFKGLEFIDSLEQEKERKIFLK